MWPGKDIVLAFGLLSLCIGSALGSVFLYMAPIYLDRFRGFHLVLFVEINYFSTGPHAWFKRSGRMYVTTKNQSFPSLCWLSGWRKTQRVKESPWARKAWNHFTSNRLRNQKAAWPQQLFNSVSVQNCNQFSWTSVFHECWSWFCFFRGLIILGYWDLVPFCS